MPLKNAKDMWIAEYARMFWRITKYSQIFMNQEILEDSRSFQNVCFQIYDIVFEFPILVEAFQSF